MFEFYWTSELIVVGSNEDRDVIGDVFFVVAESKEGQRFRHCDTTDDQETVDALLATIKANPPAPLDNVEWHEVAPCYGSAHHAKVGDIFLL